MSALRVGDESLPYAPRLQGYQQRRSSPLGGESLNLSERGGFDVLMGTVSKPASSHHWPDRVPSRSTLTSLRTFPNSSSLVSARLVYLDGNQQQQKTESPFLNWENHS